MLPLGRAPSAAARFTVRLHAMHTRLTQQDRDRFDDLLEEAIDNLPPGVRSLLEEVPVIVDDQPDRPLADSLAKEWGETPSAQWRRKLAEELAGLHSGVMLTERSVETPHSVPEDIRLFRRGIIALAERAVQEDHQHPELRPPDDPEPLDPDDALYEQIWITLVHEIGHHFGLSEEDLDQLGYA